MKIAHGVGKIGYFRTKWKRKTRDNAVLITTMHHTFETFSTNSLITYFLSE